ncbi:MAG: hypothetical protein WCO78_03195 [Candidatus Roizmanbacteria bacterium]
MVNTILKTLLGIFAGFVVSMSTLGKSLFPPKPASYIAVAPVLTPTTQPSPIPTTLAMLPTSTAAPIPTTPPLKIPAVIPTMQWGVASKIADHLYQINVGKDPIMSTPAELTDALNLYRKLHNVSELQNNDGLCHFADVRIYELSDLGKLDAHEGFKKYLDNQDNWSSLPGLVSIGENNSIGYRLTGTHLVEWIFDADEEHRSNQLDPNWNQVCVRIQGTIVEILFAKKE